MDPAEADELTPLVINTIVWLVRDGTPEPDQSRRLLALVRDLTASDAQVRQIWPIPLVEYLHEALNAYLANPKPKEGSLERALGLRRAKNRPTSQGARHREIAHAVLKRLLKKRELLDVVAEDVGKEYSLSASRVKDAWAKYKTAAMIAEKLQRRETTRSDAITPTERARLKGHYSEIPLDAKVVAGFVKSAD